MNMLRRKEFLRLILDQEIVDIIKGNFADISIKETNKENALIIKIPFSKSQNSSLFAFGMYDSIENIMESRKHYLEEKHKE